RLRPLLEAQSDERHDVTLSEQPGNVSIIGRAAPLQHEAQHQTEGGSAQPAVSQEGYRKGSRTRGKPGHIPLQRKRKRA
ncbi:hypothetical protein V7N61_004428, partial [Salmonella enterica]